MSFWVRCQFPFCCVFYDWSCFKKCDCSTSANHSLVAHQNISATKGGDMSYPIGSMYGIYANIWGILMVNVIIYSIHGSYCMGIWNCCSTKEHGQPIKGPSQVIRVGTAETALCCVRFEPRYYTAGGHSPFGVPAVRLDLPGQKFTMQNKCWQFNWTQLYSALVFPCSTQLECVETSSQ